MKSDFFPLDDCAIVTPVGLGGEEGRLFTEVLDDMIGVYTQFYNFVRIHKMVKMSLAMAAKITRKLWSMEDIAALCETEAPAKREPYKKAAAT
jgi:hypothetical protein